MTCFDIIDCLYLPQVQSCFLIRFSSSYLCYEIDKKEVMLSDIENKQFVSDNLLWQLHTQPDGTFKMESFNKMVLQCDRDNKLVLDTSSSDEYKFWKREGNFIISARSHDYLGVDRNVISLHSNHCDGTDDAQKYMDECAMQKVVSCVTALIAVC